MKFFYYDAHDTYGRSTGKTVLINLYHVQEFKAVHNIYFPVFYNIIHEFGMDENTFKKIHCLL